MTRDPLEVQMDVNKIHGHQIFVQHFMAIHPVIVSKNDNCQAHDGCRREVSEPHKSVGIHPLGTMNVFTHFHSNPSNSC